jgi:hypothetical protein
MLPEALSDALGISLSEVLGRYYSISDLGERGCLIGEAMDRRRTEEEGGSGCTRRLVNGVQWLNLYIGGEMILIRVERALLNGFLFDWCP